MLYEIDIKSNFDFSNLKPILSKSEFIKFAKLNNITYILNKLNDNEPIWRLFELQLNQYKNRVFRNTTCLKPDFNDYFDLFEEVTKILNNEIEIAQLEFHSDKYKDFFRYLLNIHFEFKNHQQYKLMWNLESTYILEVINICFKNNISYAELERITRHNQIPYLYTIYKGSDYEYFYTECKNCKKKELISYFSRNKLLTKDKCFELIFANESYYTTMHTIIELNQHYFKKKQTPHLILSLIRGIVLNIEEIIKTMVLKYSNIELIRGNILKIKEENKKIFDDFDLFRYLKSISDIEKYKNIKKELNAIEKQNNNYFIKLNFLVSLPISIEKYLHIFHQTRNYVAHSNINFKDFFCDNQKNISNVLDSVVFILIYLEYLKTTK